METLQGVWACLGRTWPGELMKDRVDGVRGEAAAFYRCPKSDLSQPPRGRYCYVSMAKRPSICGLSVRQNLERGQLKILKKDRQGHGWGGSFMV